MLVLSRKAGQRIYIGADICLVVVAIGEGKVRLGIECPKGVEIWREELLPECHPAKCAGGGSEKEQEGGKADVAAPAAGPADDADPGGHD